MESRIPDRCDFANTEQPSRTATLTVQQWGKRPIKGVAGRPEKRKKKKKYIYREKDQIDSL